MNRRSYRKWSWPINAVVYNLCRLIPFRDKRLWLFGESAGQYYSDNPKYIYDYIYHETNDGVRAIWLSYNTQIIETLQNQGMEAYPIRSWKAIWLSLRCGVIVYNKSIDDLGLLPLCGGAVIVSPWHGAGFKRIHNAALSGMRLKIKRFLDHIFSWKKMDLNFATSDYNKQQFHEWFTIPWDKIIITGQARNDALINHIDKKIILDSLGISSEKRIILYMPTHRPSPNGKNIVEDIVKDLVGCNQLVKYIEQTHSEFVIKPHPLTNIKGINMPENFSLFSYGQLKVNQELLAIADILVTDYSSCFIDYALLNKPFVLYVPDETEYMNNTCGMYSEFFDVLDLCRASTPIELLGRLSSPSLEATILTNKLYKSPNDKGHYSQNAYQVIKEYIKI